MDSDPIGFSIVLHYFPQTHLLQAWSDTSPLAQNAP